MPRIGRVEIKMEEFDSLLERALQAPLSEEECAKLRAALETLIYLTESLESRGATIDKLRRILFGASTEKTRKVLKREPEAGAAREAQDRKKPKGHGRNGAESYTGATKVKVGLESLKSGDTCPGCGRGKVYASVDPGFLVRITGRAPIGAKVYEIEKLRCNLCLEVFSAPTPPGVGEEKYDAESGSMMALLKYGSGVPFYRLEHLQESLGIPLPASTQWDIVRKVAAAALPAHKELIRQAAQGDVLHNDDTTAKILALMKEYPARERAEQESGEDSRRTGIFTSGIVSTREGQKIALFFTGRKHAGENLADVLAQRASELGPPIQMCDALSRNMSEELHVILGNCTAHGRRQFVEVAGNFPSECRYVLETLAAVYRNDALAREQGMSPQERLVLHQTNSGPLMEKLQMWFDEQFAQRKVEPNSGLGKAISYMQKHWKKLTLFLRVPGAPLDNNICERILKKAILHRKNALFFKTVNGARVGDVLMSLIHTCELSGSNPFDYLTQLQKHARALALNPQDWMPWNYRHGSDTDRAVAQSHS